MSAQNFEGVSSGESQTDESSVISDVPYSDSDTMDWDWAYGLENSDTEADNTGTDEALNQDLDSEEVDMVMN